MTPTRSQPAAPRRLAPSPFSEIPAAIEDVRAGRMVIVCDNEDRENEGDLVIAAEHARPDAINLMAREARGLICLALNAARCDELGLEPMSRRNESSFETAFTGSIDAREGITTGISAQDRAHTIGLAIDPGRGRADLVEPGHVFPLRARPGGVLERTGHTEAAVDLARLAGLTPAGVICEILNEDGTMARIPDLAKRAAELGLRMITVADLVAYRHRNETLIERVAEARMPTEHGPFTVVAYRSLLDGKSHVAAVKGELAAASEVLVRMHSECLTGDVFGSLRCDCGVQLRDAMALIAAEGTGVVVYLAQEGRGIGIVDKIRAYELQDRQGLDTVDANLALGLPADLRDFGIGAQILADLGLSSIRLLTNNPKKVIGLEGYGIEIVDQVPIEPAPNEHNGAYLRTKAERLGHRLALVEQADRPRSEQGGEA